MGTPSHKANKMLRLAVQSPMRESDKLNRSQNTRNYLLNLLLFVLFVNFVTKAVSSFIPDKTDTKLGKTRTKLVSILENLREL